MGDRPLTANESAQRLGIETPTLYDWLAKSDVGELVIRGESVTIDYLQGGPRGQGRILIEPSEVERVKDAMRVRPRATRPPTAQIRPREFNHITVMPGRPDDEP